MQNDNIESLKDYYVFYFSNKVYEFREYVKW